MNILFLLNPKDSVAYIYEDSTIRQGLEKMRVHKYSAIPVLARDGSYAGTVTEGDFLWHMVGIDSNDLHAMENHQIRHILRKDWNGAVKISATMEDLLHRVMEQNFVPVIDDRNLFVGIITRKDVIRTLVCMGEELKNA